MNSEEKRTSTSFEETLWDIANAEARGVERVASFGGRVYHRERQGGDGRRGLGADRSVRSLKPIEQHAKQGVVAFKIALRETLLTNVISCELYTERIRLV